MLCLVVVCVVCTVRSVLVYCALAHTIFGDRDVSSVI